MMKRKINRKAVLRIIKERRALRRIARHNHFGQVLPGEAFGIGSLRDFAVRARESKDYLFTITYDKHSVMLEIDTWTAINGNPSEHHLFDVDAWDAGKVYLEAEPPSRSAYRELHRAARMLLSGCDLRLSSGEYVKGVPSCANT